jgi:carbonic anhydrase/acetyltransferase-like protein (isoleucine patch superfamily)
MEEYRVEESMPSVHPSSYISASAVIIGDVTIGRDCGVFPHAVIRGDENKIIIDDGTNIQDCSVIHVDTSHSVRIGKNVTVGHSAVIHGAVIEDDCLIGIHATVLNGARIGSGSIIGANALVIADMKVPENSLVLGVPGKIVKQDPGFRDMNRSNAETYKSLVKRYKANQYEHYILP